MCVLTSMECAGGGAGAKAARERARPEKEEGGEERVGGEDERNGASGAHSSLLSARSAAGESNTPRARAP